MILRIFVFVFFHLPLRSASAYDIFSKDFQIFSKDICKSGCTTVMCFPNTLISIDLIKPLTNSDDSKCNQFHPSQSISPYNCHFKYFENHIFKTCSNTAQCELCLHKIESEYLPNALCTSDHDFIIKYRCIPSFIKNDNVCADSYLDIDCFDNLEEKLVILNATLYPEINSTLEDPRGCNAGNLSLSKGNWTNNSDNSPKKKVRCRKMDKTNHAISKCSYRPKCSIGPNKFTPLNCGNMHLRLSHACVPKSVLAYYNKPVQEKPPRIITMKTIEIPNDSNSWFKKNKWTILSISIVILITLSFISSLLIYFNKRSRRQRTSAVNAPKDNLFNQLGKKKFTPPPSSIDKVNMEFENGNLAPPDIYNCNSDNEEMNIRSLYSHNIPNNLSYNTQFCNPPPSINTRQYFTPLLSPSHINMLEMPAIQLGSSGNLTSSTINSSLGTPRGTKSSGIFSMTDMSFENTHLV